MSRDNNPRDILLRPVVSEKSYGLLDEGKYTFLVTPGANKTQIRLAVEAVFGVKVTGVNTVNRPGKRRRTRYGWGQRPDTKRAIVTLAAGDGSGLFGGSVGSGRRDATRLSESTSRPPLAGAGRAVPTSPRSPGPSRRSRWCARCTRRAAGTCTVASPPGIRAAATSGPTG